jgi:hypothetical protein
VPVTLFLDGREVPTEYAFKARIRVYNTAAHLVICEYCAELYSCDVDWFCLSAYGVLVVFGAGRTTMRCMAWCCRAGAIAARICTIAARICTIAARICTIAARMYRRCKDMCHRCKDMHCSRNFGDTLASKSCTPGFNTATSSTDISNCKCSRAGCAGRQCR